MQAGEIQKTVIITSFGMFKLLRLYFGLKNAGLSYYGSCFHSMMDQIYEIFPTILFI